jgi:WD40 repeat protein
VTRTKLRLAAVLVFSAATAPAAEPARTDALGDPLPSGAVLRLGTIRWRAGSPIVFLAALPDGHVLTVDQQQAVRVWDAATGRERQQFPMTGTPGTTVPAAIYNACVSLDGGGRNLAVAGRNGIVTVWDVAAGRATGRVVTPETGIPTRIALSRDGKTLALGVNIMRPTLWDVAADKEIRALDEIRPAAGENVNLTRIEFGHDNRTLLGTGYQFANGTNQGTVVAWDTATGKVLHRHLFNYGSNVSFAPDVRTFAVAVQGAVTLFDLGTGRELRKFEESPHHPYALTFSPDGRTLIAVAAPDAVTVWDVDTGRVLRRFGPSKAATPAVLTAPFPMPALPSVTPDGKTLVWVEGQTVRRKSLENGDDLPGPPGHAAPLRQVHVGPGGTSFLTRTVNGQMLRWDAATGRPLGPFAVPAEGAFNVMPSADERWAVAWRSNAPAVLVAADTGQVHFTLPADPDLATPTVEISPDSRTLAAVGRAGMTVRLYDVPDGRPRGELHLPTAPPPDPRTGFVPDPALRRLAFSPDSRRVAVYAGRDLVAWDVASGRQLPVIVLPDGTAVRHIAFAPDGRTLAVEFAGGGLELWELATGGRRAALAERSVPSHLTPQAATMRTLQLARVAHPLALAYSPDGRLLAEAGDDRTIRLWDVAAGRVADTFTGHRGEVASVAFTPDGRRLATASTDTTALVWDVEPVRAKLIPPPSATLTPERAEALWTDLASNDAAKAYDAVRALAGDPAAAVTLLRDRLKPAAGPDAERVAKLIADLDAAAYAVRTRAEKELRRLGDQVAPALREALEANPSLELRRRLEGLLDGMNGPPAGEQLRQLRALEVLERVGTPGAAEVLTALAAGAAGAPTTVEARAALDRLGRRGGA